MTTHLHPQFGTNHLVAERATGFGGNRLSHPAGQRYGIDAGAHFIADGAFIAMPIHIHIAVHIAMRQD